MLFQYEGYTTDGSSQRGIIEAKDKQDAALKLYQREIVIVSLTEAKNRKPTISLKDQILFTRLLTNALSAHLPLTRALEIIAQEFPQRHPLKLITLDLIRQIQGGESLSQAMEMHPEAFSPFAVSMVKAGEESGELASTVNSLLHYLQKRLTISQKISSALLYPGFIFVFALAVLFFFAFVLIPQFEQNYAQFGAELPLFTRVLMSGTRILREWAWLAVLVVGLGIGGYLLMREKRWFRHWKDSTLLSLPLVGDLLNKDILTRFSRTLSVLLSSDVVLSEALELCRGVVENMIYEDMITRAIQDINQGRKLTDSFRQNRFLPPTFIQMIGMGEETSRIDQLSGYLADFYERDVDSAVEKITTLLTPILIIFIGIIVGFIIVALFLPIFQLSKIL
ncbi:type II secretion system F family protein [Thermospira aquatica]|uniref:Type II secretion system F family protein n=1 Tax=Thermospira aquatica TaxID=2828656 RepID=A0AAX3BF46_9SPIR|nr:type II secretion system F family protein [Thermospira aquatica]URA10836.1 type II secretion system F family protein [Thermospira aquatica]